MSILDKIFKKKPKEDEIRIDLSNYMNDYLQGRSLKQSKEEKYILDYIHKMNYKQTKDKYEDDFLINKVGLNEKEKQIVYETKGTTFDEIIDNLKDEDVKKKLIKFYEFNKQIYEGRQKQLIEKKKKLEIEAEKASNPQDLLDSLDALDEFSKKEEPLLDYTSEEIAQIVMNDNLFGKFRFLFYVIGLNEEERDIFYKAEGNTFEFKENDLFFRYYDTYHNFSEEDKNKAREITNKIISRYNELRGYINKLTNENIDVDKVSYAEMFWEACPISF